MLHEKEHGPLIVELHFVFLGMNVYVNALWIDVDPHRK
jgi:hypothetical protein